MKKRRKWSQGKASLAEIERVDLEAGLLQTRQALTQAYAGFNTATDPDLVESFVYEIRALQSRYSYLLRRRKALEGPHVPTSEAALPAV